MHTIKTKMTANWGCGSHFSVDEFVPPGNYARHSTAYVKQRRELYAFKLKGTPMQQEWDNAMILRGFSLCHILRDKRITKTQKYILLTILCLDAEQNFPERIELPYRSLSIFDVRGHGHIRENITQLQLFGYLKDVYFDQREDGYRIMMVKVNRYFHFSGDSPPEGVA